MKLLSNAEISLVNGGFSGLETVLLSMIGGGIAGFLSGGTNKQHGASIVGDLGAAVDCVVCGYFGAGYGLVLGLGISVIGVTTVTGVLSASIIAGSLVVFTRK